MHAPDPGSYDALLSQLGWRPKAKKRVPVLLTTLDVSVLQTPTLTALRANLAMINQRRPSTDISIALTAVDKLIMDRERTVSEKSIVFGSF